MVYEAAPYKTLRTIKQPLEMGLQQMKLYISTHIWPKENINYFLLMFNPTWI